MRTIRSKRFHKHVHGPLFLRTSLVHLSFAMSEFTNQSFYDDLHAPLGFDVENFDMQQLLRNQHVYLLVKDLHESNNSRQELLNENQRLNALVQELRIDRSHPQ